MIKISGFLLSISLFILSCDNTNTGTTSKIDSTGSDKIIDTAIIAKAVKDSTDMVLKKLTEDLGKAEKEKDSLKALIPKPKQPMAIPAEADKTTWMRDIDWLSQHPEAPAQLRCLYYVVAGGGGPKLRGNASAEECLRNSIQAYRDNNLELALNWLCAGQCHNDDAQQGLRQAGVNACQYAYQQYGSRSP